MRTAQVPKRRLVPVVLGVIVGLLVGVGGLMVDLYSSHSKAWPPVRVPAQLLPAPPASPEAAQLPVTVSTVLPVPKIPKPLPPLTVVSRIITNDPVIFVTIDDGVYKPADAAEYITRHKIPLVEFLTTSIAGHNTGYFAVLQKAGATIGNHTLVHPHLPRLTYEQQKQEICQASDHLKEWYGVRPTLLRPPYGEFDDKTKQAAAACGISHIVTWTVVMSNGVLSYQKPGGLAPGDIVLLHFRPELKHELELLTQAAHDRGLRIAKLEDYLKW